MSLVYSLFLILSFGSALTVGECEHALVFIGDDSFLLDARIDTGAARSSLDARDIRVTEPSRGSKQVTFTIKDRSGRSERKYTLPVAGEVEVKSANGVAKRYIVNAKICLGDRLIESEFTLHDRRKMTFPLLIGRNLLKDGYLVDITRAATLGQPRCAETPK